MKVKTTISGIAATFLAIACTAILPANAHHSFAMYDMRNTVVITGVVTRVDPAPNHLQIFFAPMSDDRKGVVRDENGEPVVWSVEMAGSAASAREGISVNSFPRGTIFSVGLHPLRNGKPGGSRVGGLIKCPAKTPPEAGKHCDSVEGNEELGRGPLAEPVTAD